MADGYQITHASLEKHESDIREVMSQVKGAIDTVRDPIDFQAFGIIGQSWAGYLNLWIDAHTRCVDAAVEAGNQTADNVKSMNENYKNNEDTVAKGFTAIQADQAKAV
jgi:hypothetical protein